MALTLENKKTKIQILAIRNGMMKAGFHDAAENFYNRARGLAGPEYGPAYPPRRLEFLATHYGCEIST